MNIELKRNYGFELIYTDDNIKVVEDIESRIYPKDENGKTIINLSPKRDIKDEFIEQYARILDDMIHYREAEFDSSDLILSLFDKLPKDMAVDLASKLAKYYTPEDEDEY